MFDNFVKSSPSSSYSPSNIILKATPKDGCLMIGDFNSAIDPENIKLNNIKTIITAASNMDHLQIPKSINHIIYPLLDSKTQDISKFFRDNYETIDGSLKRGGVLVHCAAGISRSATLVIAYLMKKNSWGFKEAIAFVRKFRPEVCPNLGFEMQLKKYQKELKRKEGEEKLTKSLVQNKSNLTATTFNDLFMKQTLKGFPNIPSLSRGDNRIRQIIRNRPHSKDSLQMSQYNQFSDKLRDKSKDFMMTSFPYKLKPKTGDYHSSSLYKNHQELDQRQVAINKKIAALMFQNNLSRSFGPGNGLRKSEIKLSGFK